MFEPKTYAEKRAAMNEILTQQLANVVLRIADPQTKPHVQMMLEQYGRGQQTLRDVEANRVLGPVAFEDQVTYANSQTILDYLMSNVGRTYFGTEHHTLAPNGSIGTPGFGIKFKDWLASLPEYDNSISKDMVSGFYRDTVTNGMGNPLPLLILRNGNELIAVLFRVYVSVMTLNLDHVPADYRWESTSHYPLRGEMFSYRGDLTVAKLEEELTAALAVHGITDLVKPKLPELPESEVVSENVVVRDFETDMVRLSDPEIFDADRDLIHAHWSSIFDKQLADDPTKEIYDQKARLTIALFGPVNILEFEDWKEEHHEAHKQMIEAGDVIDDSGMEREETEDGDVEATDDAEQSNPGDEDMPAGRCVSME
jgi:hypothetical protein